jgi:proteasome lid subunit RPN8/RPN11
MRNRRQLECVGDMHSHPLLGSRAPSPDDLHAFALSRSHDRYLALLASRAANGWRLTPWVVRGGWSRDVAERATLT